MRPVLSAGDEALERHVLDLDGAMEVSAERVGHVDADAGRIAVRVGHLERRVIEFHADDEGLGGVLRRKRRIRCQQRQKREESEDEPAKRHGRSMSRGEEAGKPL